MGNSESTPSNGDIMLTDEEADKVKAELAPYQVKWREHFNTGDFNYIADQYFEDAVLFAHPVGTHRGRENIRGFWKKLVDDGVTDFEQTDSITNVVNAKKCMVSAKWEMNKFGGLIHCEVWVKVKDGSWKILVDHFEITQQKE